MEVCPSCGEIQHSYGLWCGTYIPFPYCLVWSYQSRVWASRRIPDGVVPCSGNQLQGVSGILGCLWDLRCCHWAAEI